MLLYYISLYRATLHCINTYLPRGAALREAILIYIYILINNYSYYYYYYYYHYLSISLSLYLVSIYI